VAPLGIRKVASTASLQQKGGSGKTTLAVNLAAAAHLEGRRTLVVDMDRQASAFDWRRMAFDDEVGTWVLSPQVVKNSGSCCWTFGVGSSLPGPATLPAGPSSHPVVTAHGSISVMGERGQSAAK
jgi:CobQ/CobB/MinD/ParA family nucleotide binding protein